MGSPQCNSTKCCTTSSCRWVPGPIIVGAGPSGMAVAACLADLGIPSTLLEKSGCIASLWQERTYDRLKLHLPKQFCELPLMGFPPNFPKYPSKHQFVSYLESYAARFGIRPLFGRAVASAGYDAKSGCWKVRAKRTRDWEGAAGAEEDGEVFVSRWLVVATGENAEPVVPELPGLDKFGGRVIHTCSYKSGAEFRGEKVLVVGCGNSGMEVSLDLCRNSARPYMVARNPIHVLPREMLGLSTFAVAMALLKWLPLRWVDKFLLLGAHLSLGSTGRLGLHRPKTGPIELKNTTGKTPVLDVGALSYIRSGKIRVVGEVKEVTKAGVRFIDSGEDEVQFDSIVLATGYRSNVAAWLKEEEEEGVAVGDDRDGSSSSSLFNEEGKPKKAFPHGWKGRKGLYSVGFTLRGILGTCSDAHNIATDVADQWKKQQDRSNTVLLTTPTFEMVFPTSNNSMTTSPQLLLQQQQDPLPPDPYC